MNTFVPTALAAALCSAVFAASAAVPVITDGGSRGAALIHADPAMQALLAEATSEEAQKWRFNTLLELARIASPSRFEMRRQAEITRRLVEEWGFAPEDVLTRPDGFLKGAGVQTVDGKPVYNVCVRIPGTYGARPDAVSYKGQLPKVVLEGHIDTVNPAVLPPAETPYEAVKLQKVNEPIVKTRDELKALPLEVHFDKNGKVIEDEIWQKAYKRYQNIEDARKKDGYRIYVPGYNDAMINTVAVMQVAKQFPNVYFEHATGYKTSKNVKNYTARFYEGRYLAGMLAAATTKTNILGYVAALPIPEVFQGINAYTLGARAVNPNIEVRVVWTSSWYDPGKEADATKALIGMKADVITHHTNSTAVASTCEEAKVPVISYNSAMHKAAPTMLLGGVVHRWEEYYTNEIQKVLDGKWDNTPVWGGANVHMIELADMTPKAPENVASRIKATYAKLEKGEFHPFTGPVVSNEGKVMIPEGKVATDEELQQMMYFVEGVASKVPTAK